MSGELQFNEEETDFDSEKENRTAEKRAAFNRILKLCKFVPNFDEKKSLAEYREEKFT